MKKRLEIDWAYRGQWGVFEAATGNLTATCDTGEAGIYESRSDARRAAKTGLVGDGKMVVRPCIVVIVEDRKPR